MATERFLPNMTWSEVAALDKSKALVVLPVGATEQHGHHLPLYTDTIISSGVLMRALERLEDDEPAYGLSPITISKSNEHRGFPGTLFLKAKTLYDVLFDIGRSVHESGFRKLCFFNGHGGNVGILHAVTRDIRDEFGMTVFAGSAGTFMDAPELPEGVDEREKSFGIHANFTETALIKAMTPDLVKEDLAKPCFPNYPETGIGLVGKGYAQWKTEDWSATGVFGDPTGVTDEIADAYLESAVEGSVRFLREMIDYEYDRPARES
ncbi:MAG: creatininase family protein [Symploca sp. SIO2D2]|nr:creatininase family protein [Symploca sp. SIO2D2]